MASIFLSISNLFSKAIEPIYRQMPNAQCPMPNAQCPMPNAPFPIFLTAHTV
ncbi:MAG: hypothetical protein F6J93_17930 [Oscillatoria sp. SIO1A7]|nr:hypothetical protein [Oscillatoria sp. SIO1A7]